MKHLKKIKISDYNVDFNTINIAEDKGNFSTNSSFSMEDGDDLYQQALKIILDEKRPTTSYLQRRLKIGYNKAASLIEQMEAEGVLSPPNSQGKREILKN